MKTKANIRLAVALIFAVTGGVGTPVSVSSQEAKKAEAAPPSYKASPEVYKLISENEHFRVFEVTWKPGQRDAWHSHPGPLTAYSLTDCEAMRAHTPDGKFTDRGRKAGTVTYNPVIASHSLENRGKTDCKIIIVERK